VSIGLFPGSVPVIGRSGQSEVGGQVRRVRMMQLSSMVAWMGGIWLMLLAVPVGVCVLGFDAIRVLSAGNPMMAVKVGLVIFFLGAGLFTVGQLTRKRAGCSGPNENTTRQNDESSP